MPLRTANQVMRQIAMATTAITPQAIEEIGECRLRLLVDLHRVLARGAAERGEVRRQAGDLVVEIEHRDEAGAAADAQQEQ